MERAVFAVLLCLVLLAAAAGGARALDRPWISDVFFYWYTWDYDRAWGSWEGGVYYTPLAGYYDSRSYQDNLRELRLSGEWGMTHHFMDYWDRRWTADTGEPRDLILMKATQALADEGYNAWMSYYQDGDNFAMRDFARNVTEKRDVWNWLQHYAPFRVWPRLNGKPFQLVYSRNGSPELTADDAGFRAFLRDRYADVEALSRAWSEDVKSFDDIRVDFGATGPRRADAIDYQYQLWGQDWARLQDAVRAEFSYPGVAASFDVAYAPFRNFSYGDFARVFGGPHSYGGVFGQPDEQDAPRFVQSIVAKKYGTVFFDHLKHTYNDWNTGGRIPGTAYAAEPCHFDRFWVGDLMRYNEAVLHLSWNEWWEGSNLEPSRELGKTYCEKNLLYSTLMQWCFPSLRDFGRQARAAVLLNDWAFKCGAPGTSDIYFAIQEMRRSMTPFDLLVDDLVTAKELERFDLIIAPAAGIGFGCNSSRERIGDLLKRWVEGGRNRRLVVTACPEFADYLGLKPQPAPPAARPGPDLNVFVDVGAPGDARFLLGGYSGAEAWGGHTSRWTPGGGRVTTVLLPASPNRDHILRLAGNAVYPSKIEVRVGGTAVGAIAAQEGDHDYAVAIPAAAVGGARTIEVQFVYDHQVIPGQLDPKTYPGEARACNLAVNWFQFSTANIGPSREQRYRWPSRRVEFASADFGDLQGRTVKAEWRTTPALAADGASVLSTYAPDGTARDLLFSPRGRLYSIWYVNGRFEDVADPGAFAAPLSDFPRLRPQLSVRGRHVMGAGLAAGTTNIVLAYNQDITKPSDIVVEEKSAGRLPVAEVSMLSRDGDRDRPIEWHDAGDVRFTDRISYYGVYSIVHAPVRIEHAPLTLAPGERKVVAITLHNITDRVVTGAISLASVIPTLATDGAPAVFAAPAGGSVTVQLPIRARETADWGLKTVALLVKTDAGVAYFWRPLRVLPLPDLQFTAGLVNAARPSLTIENGPLPWSARAAARSVTLTVGRQVIRFGDIASGARSTRQLVAPAGEGISAQEATLSYMAGGRRVEEKRTLRFAHPVTALPAPANAVRAVAVFNPRDSALANEPVAVALPEGLRADRLHLADAGGQPVPAQIDDGRTLNFIASVPPRSARVYYLCRGPGQSATSDLVVRRQRLGTGRGTVRIENSCFAVVLSESRGGTMTTFRSKASGADYAADSFGLTYGQWSQSDPRKPAHTATEYILDKRTYSRDAPAAIEVVSAGPAGATIRVTWSDAAVEAVQVYRFYAFANRFAVSSQVRPKQWRAGDELVALDGRFARNRLSKIYPGFSGQPQVFDQSQPHFGWREVPRAPEYASLLAPPDFAEGISILPVRLSGVDRWRQGFWPAKRPEPGPCKYAEVEFAATRLTKSGVTVEAWVMLHSGSHTVARQALADLANQPLLTGVPLR